MSLIPQSTDVENSARLRKLILDKCHKYPAFGDQHIGFDVNAESEQIIETVSSGAKFITRKTAEKTKELFDISNKPISLPEVPSQFGALIETGMHTAADAIDTIKRSLSHSTQRSAYRFLSNFDDSTGMPRDDSLVQPNSPQPQAKGLDIQDTGDLPPLRSVISRSGVNSGELDGSSNALVSSDSAIKLGAFRERRKSTAPAVISTNRHKLG